MSATDTPTQRASVVLHENGTGQVAIGDELFLLSGPDARANRAEARQKVAEHAKATAQSVEMQVTESGKSLLLLVGPDGRVSRAQAKTSTPEVSSAPSAASAPSPAPAQAPAENGSWTQGESPSEASQESTPVRDEAADVPRIEGFEDLVQATPGQGKGSYAKSTVAREHSEDVPRGWDFPSEGGQPVSAEPVFLDPQEHPSAEAPERVSVGAVGHAAAASAPGPDQPATSDPVDSDPRWEEIAAQPATQGIRGRLNGMGFHFAPAPAEVKERREELQATIAREDQLQRAEAFRAVQEREQETRRQARERELAEKDRAERDIIQTALEEPKNVLIANDKGGQGKTSGTYCIAATAGRIRGGDVIAWDANETRGNLGFRAQKTTIARSVVDLLEDAAEDFTTVEGSKRSTLARFTRAQGDNLFSVLASDEDPANQDLVDGEAFDKVNEILGRFYSLILVDTGNNHRVSHFRAALDAADQLVIPVSAGADGAHAAETMIDTFESLGHHDLVQNAVILLNDSATRTGDASGIAAKFQQRVRAIIPIPFDPALDTGDEIHFEELQAATRAAYQTATAAIASGLTGTKEDQ